MPSSYSVKVDELSPATILDYRYKIGSLVKFCHRNGIEDINAITPSHIRLFILELKNRNNSTSVVDYFGSIKRFPNEMDSCSLRENFYTNLLVSVSISTITGFANDNAFSTASSSFAGSSTLIPMPPQIRAYSAKSQLYKSVCQFG